MEEILSLNMQNAKTSKEQRDRIRAILPIMRLKRPYIKSWDLSSRNRVGVEFYYHVTRDQVDSTLAYLKGLAIELDDYTIYDKPRAWMPCDGDNH